MDNVILESLSDQELIEYKKKIEYQISEYDNIQNALKVTINSAYGTLGSAYNRWYDVRLAEAVTMTGQFIIRTVFERLNIFLNKLAKTENHSFIIAGDTDSAYLTLEPIVNLKFNSNTKHDISKIIDFMDSVCEKIIQPELDNIFKQIYNNLNGYENSISMKREALCNKGIWIKKKNYILDIYDNEHVRYNEPKLKVVGIKAIKSLTPKLCRDSIRTGLEIIMRGTEEDFFNYVKDFKNIFYSSKIEDIATPISVNDLNKYKSSTNFYKLGTPIQVRSAIMYNYLIDKLNLVSKYDKIKNKEKIKYVYLMEPNPLNHYVIGFIDKLPEEFGLHQYVDYDKQWETAFVSSLKNILEIIGWKLENKITLLDF